MVANIAKITEWVEALESGSYAQGSGKLRTPDDKFCCLGVLGDISEDCQWLPFYGPHDDYEIKFYRLFHEETGADARYILPQRLREALGISCEQQNKYVEMNDGGSTFLEIAAEICKDFGLPAKRA